MTPRDFPLVPLSLIRPTERFCPRRAAEVAARILACRCWTHPICIERSVGALLDGHHRLAAAAMLGLARVPVRILDYEEVQLSSWRADVAPTRAEVVARALRGDLYPIKTTRHVFAPCPMRPVPITRLGGCGCPAAGRRDLSDGVYGADASATPRGRV